MKSMGTPNRRNIVPCPKTADWVEIELVDDDGKPVPGEEYKIELPDGSVQTGTLDENGLARYDAIVSGQCKITFPNYHHKEWNPK